MPTTLPDPVLALSMASLQKLNTADVDQLANLWNVFTKCKESLESGRRLENLSWRLWFREAHLLPPDTSLSDLTDFTPLDTPLMSRRSSMAGSYQPSTRSMTPFVPHQPSSSFTSRALQAASMAIADPNHGNTGHTKALSGELSDPEESDDWSSDDDDDEVDATKSQEVKSSSSSNARGRAQVRSTQASSSSNQQPATRSIVSPKSVTSPLARETILTQQQQNERDNKSSNVSSNVSTTYSGDRRRAISSSSAFGSRARVKQHNMQRRRRPLSFQQAIESLLLDRESELSLNGKVGSGSTSSLPRSIDESRLPSNSSRLMDDLESSDATIAEPLPQNSAPAEFSQPSTPQKNEQLLASKKPVRRVSIVDAREEGNESQKPKEQSKDNNPSRFFVGAASYEGSEHSIEKDSYSPKMSTKMIPSDSKDKEEVALRSPVQRMKNLHPTSSSGSVEGLRKTSGTKSHHSAHHARNTSGTIRTKSALNLHRKTGQGKSRGHVRIASISKDLADQGKDTQSTESGIEQPKKNRQPVKFTMGSMEGDSDDDYSSIGSEKQASQEGVVESGKEAKGSNELTVENSDEWASDSSTDSEEERKRTAERRKRAEKERLENMFKKIPIRSQSAADLGLLAPGKNSTEEVEPKAEPAYSTSPAPPPIRSLLSTIFHPTNEDDLARRKSYANVTDLHIQGEQSSIKKKVRKTSHEGSEIAQQAGHLVKHGKSAQTTAIARPPSIGAYSNNAGLKMSKSAVALPVLSTLGSRSSTSISRKEIQGNSRDAAVFEDDSSGESSISDLTNQNTTDTSPRQSNSEAVERLNELARTRQSQKNEKKKRQQKGIERNDDHDGRRSSEEGGWRKRASNSSLDVQVQPEFDEEKMIRQYRRTSEPNETPSTQAIATSSSGKPQRSKSAINVPESGLPQSPRTTRRNMLKDELSESLRQNLLWERQSRNRMLGIGGNRVTTAPLTGNESRAEQQQDEQEQRFYRSDQGNGFAPLTQTTSAPMQQSTPSSVALSQSQSQQGQSNNYHRNQSVLGGNALRPLTQRSTVPDPNTNRTNRQSGSSSRVTYSGDFHHTGW